LDGNLVPLSSSFSSSNVSFSLRRLSCNC
jgi:hypothetical protein